MSNSNVNTDKNKNNNCIFVTDSQDYEKGKVNDSITNNINESINDKDTGHNSATITTSSINQVNTQVNKNAKNDLHLK